MFGPIIQIMGDALKTYKIVNRMGVEETMIGVKATLKRLEVIPESNIMMGHFDLNLKGKKTKMNKAWRVYKKGVEKDYNLDEFVAYMEENQDLLPKEIVESLIEIGNGLGYLYH
ncbi:hypothetical protein SUGI_0336960 [Cryptomeria japonica]|nr:hypothetical protein SUGI_0336960 [Cryptomeria japonica]